MLFEKWYHGAVQATGTIYTIGGSDNFSETAAGYILDNTEAGTVPTCSVQVDANVTVSGSGTGKVYSTPGIDCGSDCNERYCVGTPVTFTAIAGSGSEFLQWSGDCTGTDVSCTLEMNTNKTITAEFSIPSCPECPSDGIITNVTYPENETCSCTNATLSP